MVFLMVYMYLTVRSILYGVLMVYMYLTVRSGFYGVLMVYKYLTVRSGFYGVFNGVHVFDSKIWILLCF